MTKKTIIFIVAISLFLGSTAQVPGSAYNSNNTIYVDDDAPPGGDGSLQHPFQNINDGIDAANAGDTVFVFSGEYEEYLEFSKSISLIGESNETTILCGLSGIEVSDVDGLVVNGFKLNESVGIHLYRVYNSFICNNILKFSEIMLSNSSFNTVENNLILEGRSYGIRLWYYSEYNIISNNTIFSEGIEVDAENNIIKGNRLDNCSISVSGYDNSVISNNLIENIYGSSGATGIKVLWCDNAIVRDNIIRNLSGSLGATGIDIGWSENAKILNNAISNLIGGNGADGISISFDESQSAIIEDNKITNIHGGLNSHGIKISTASHHKVTDNIISDITSGGYSDGVYIEGSSNNEIIGNKISQCGYSCIYLLDSSNNNIKENALIGVWPTGDGFGICFGGFVLNTIISKNIIENNSRGMYVSIGCTKNTISENIINDNGEGIVLGRGDNDIGGASNNIITANEISKSSRYGIYCEEGSKFNRLYCNNFLENRDGESGGNAYDAGFNFWFKFLGFKGNYWDDLPTSQRIYRIPPKFFFNNDWFPLKQPY